MTSVAPFREARQAYIDARKPFEFERIEEYRNLWKAMRETAAPDHIGRDRGEFMSDYVDCSCGWSSPGHWDGQEYAWAAWREHVADVLGLIPRKCPCGKTYVPADAKPCHELQETT